MEIEIENVIRCIFCIFLPRTWELRTQDKMRECDNDYWSKRYYGTYSTVYYNQRAHVAFFYHIVILCHNFNLRKHKNYWEESWLWRLYAVCNEWNGNVEIFFTEYL